MLSLMRQNTLGNFDLKFGQLFAAAEDWVHVNQKKKMAAQREPNQVEILVALKEH